MFYKPTSRLIFIFILITFFFRGEGPLKTSQDLIHFLEVSFIFTSTWRDRILKDKRRKVTGGGWRLCKVVRVGALLRWQVEGWEGQSLQRQDRCDLCTLQSQEQCGWGLSHRGVDGTAFLQKPRVLCFPVWWCWAPSALGSSGGIWCSKCFDSTNTTNANDTGRGAVHQGRALGL